MGTDSVRALREAALLASLPEPQGVSALPGNDQPRELPQHLVDLCISAEQAANLRTLASYLLTLPAEYPDFEMASYVRGVDSEALVEMPECGTAACAAGHGPKAGVAPLFGETWETYSERAFTKAHRPWGWCFSGMWVTADNTAHGAARRILWMLEHGVPADLYQQQRGERPLCYLDAPEAA